jgi:hypothetical protein
MGERTRALKLPRVRTNTLALVTLGWSAVVLGVLVWQAILYRGLVANIGEWQFAQFSRYFPFATIIVLFVLFTLPLYAILYRRFRRWARRLGASQQGIAMRIERARFWKTTLIATTTLLVVVSLGVIGHAYTIGSMADKELAFTVGAPGSADPGEGQRRIRGLGLLDRIAVYSENYVVARREFAVLPVVAPGDNGKTLTYFVQVEDPVAASPRMVQSSGFLRQERLPGALRALYVKAGYTVTAPAWILYRSTDSARWTHLRIAGIIALCAMLTGLLALQQIRRLQRLSTKSE